MVKVDFKWHIHSRTFDMPVVPRVGETVTLESEGVYSRLVENVSYLVEADGETTAIVKLADY